MRKSVVFLILIVFSSSSFAQFSRFKTNPFSNSIIFGLEGGLSQSETDFVNTDLNIAGAATIEYFLRSNSDIFFGLKLETGYNYISGDQTNESNLIKFNADVLSFGPSATLNYTIGKSFFPYIGFGVKNLWYNDFTSLDIVGEIGARYLISEYFAITGNVKLNFLNEDNLDGLAIYKSNNDFFTTFSVGLSYAVDLTVNSDLDGDGIKNVNDNCAEQAEDFDGFEDDDGCPEFDNDGDGIVDAKDSCPNEAEDFDGFEDSDGCPDPDNDGDNILDSDDQCPDLAEDFDGFEDNDGCPELDNDKDGIVDQNDKCPNDAETFNSFEDSDGCPDKVPETEIIEEIKPEIKTTEKSTIIKNKTRVAIPNEFLLEGDEYFTPSGRNLKSAGIKTLNKIANQMKNNPDSKWRIEGHLDNSASPSELRTISTARANTVKNYLVYKGLSSKSFQAVGLADKFPLAPNSTIHGRLKNRRVIIKRVR